MGNDQLLTTFIAVVSVVVVMTLSQQFLSILTFTICNNKLVS